MGFEYQPEQTSDAPPRGEVPAPTANSLPSLADLPFRPASRYYRAEAGLTAPATRYPSWLVFSSVVLAALLAHGLCVRSVFYREDWSQILGNDAVDHGQWLETGLRLLTNFSYWLTYAFFGPSPVAFHAGNLLLHLILTGCVAGFARDFLAGAASFTSESARRVGWWAALLFAVHPLGSEVLNYARMRDIELTGLFTLLAAWAALRWRRQDRPGFGWPVLTLLAVAAATFCKEVGFLLAAGTAALVFFGTTYTAARRGNRNVALPLPGPSTKVKTKLVSTPKDAAMVKGNWPVTLSLGLVGACLALAAWPAWQKAYAALHHPQLGWHTLTKTRVFWMYLQRAVLPVNLCSNHDLAWTVGLGDGVAWLSAAGELAVIVLAVFLYGRRPGPVRAVGTLLCVVLLDIVHRLANPDAELMVESRMYPALVPVCILLAWGIDRLAGRRADGKTPRLPVLSASILGVLVLAGMALSIRRAQTWNSLDALVQDVVARYPLQMSAWQELQERDLRAHYWTEVTRDQIPIRKALADSLAFNARSTDRKYFPGPLLLSQVRSEGNLCRALANLGRRNEAYEHLEELKTAVPTSGEAALACQAEYLYATGLVDEVTHREKEAFDALTASVKLTGHPEAARALRRLQAEGIANVR